MANDVPRTRLTDAESDSLYQAVHGALRSHATPRIDPDTDLDAAMHYIDAAVERIVARRQENAWDEGHAASERDWKLTFDLSTPDEDREPWTNPYRTEARP